MTNALLTSPITRPMAGRVHLKAEVLKWHRHQLGLSQEALAAACFAQRLCVSIASVKRAETGKPLLLRTASHLATFLGLELHSLLGDEPVVVDMADAHDGDVETPDAVVHHARHDGSSGTSLSESRLVLLVCIWPVSERERPEVDAALLAEGATLMPAPAVDTVLAVMGLPRAQRSDLGCCLNAALPWRDRHVMVASGIWLDNTLDWPQDLVHEWLRRQPASVYVHRSMFGQVRALHQIDPAGHPDIGRLGQAHRPIRRPFKLAGRQHEMRLFGSLLDAVLLDQQSQVMLVQGMAGMGKSRLMAEVMDKAQQSFMSTVLVEIPEHGGDRDRAVIVNWLKHLLDLHEVTPFWDQLASQRLQQFGLPTDQTLLCKDLLALRMDKDEHAQLQVMGRAARARIEVQMLVRIMGSMASQRPMLIAIEDVHWASSRLIEVFARIIDASQEARIIWVLSGRAEVPQRAGELQRLIPDVAVTSLTLAPLKAHDARDLARQFDHLDEAWRTQCMQRAKGHPLFLMQLLMADQRAQLPDDFQHLLQVRLDEVSPQGRRVLRMAALLGQAFGADDMPSLMGEAAHELDALVQHGLLRQLGGERYDFLHPMIRQGVYESLPRRQREAMYDQLARQVERRASAMKVHHLHARNMGYRVLP